MIQIIIIKNDIEDILISVDSIDQADYMFGNGNYITEDDTNWATHPLIIKQKADKVEREKKELISLIQNHIDTTAQSRGYDNGISCSTYAGVDNPYRAEAEAFILWRSEIWEYCYGKIAILIKEAEDNNTDIVFPPAEEVINQLPKINWV